MSANRHGFLGGVDGVAQRSTAEARVGSASGAQDDSLNLTLDGTPPSLNQIPDMGAPLRTEAAAWQARIAELLPTAPPALARMEAAAALAFPDRRRRSAANYAAVLERALADALVERGWLATPDRLVFELPAFAQGEPATTIELRCWGSEP